ncbi:hypothetical protein EMCRGX_G028693 [Ephydatia muelleri]
MAEARETLAVETYGCWGAEARETLLYLATRLAIPMRCTKSKATASIYGRLSFILCASFCKLVHLACSTPPSLVSEGLALFDEEVRHYFSDCVAIDALDSDWLQVQLSLSRGGLGLRRLALHCSAAYLPSMIKAGCADPLNECKLLLYTIPWFLLASSVAVESLLDSGLSQKNLSTRIDDHQFDQLCLISSPANRACLLSVSSLHASSWLAVIPSRGLNLSLEPEEFQLDPLGHHAMTCKGGGDVVMHHNALRDVFSQFCHSARLGGQLEVGHGSGADSPNSRPADILVPNWMIGKPAAFDLM